MKATVLLSSFRLFSSNYACRNGKTSSFSWPINTKYRKEGTSGPWKKMLIMHLSYWPISFSLSPSAIVPLLYGLPLPVVCYFPLYQISLTASKAKFGMPGFEFWSDDHPTNKRKFNFVIAVASRQGMSAHQSVKHTWNWKLFIKI